MDETGIPEYRNRGIPKEEKQKENCRRNATKMQITGKYSRKNATKMQIIRKLPEYRREQDTY